MIAPDGDVSGELFADAPSSAQTSNASRCEQLLALHSHHERQAGARGGASASLLDQEQEERA